MINKKKQENRSDNVNEDIEEMIALYLQSAEVVVQGKTETGDGPVHVVRGSRGGKECSFDAFPGKVFQVELRVLGYGMDIVKMPRTVQRIAIGDDNQKRQGRNGKAYLAAFGNRLVFL